MSRVILILLLCLSLSVHAQSPVPMAYQPMLSYLETFDSILVWTNNFSSGKGSDKFSAVAIGGTATIPDASRVTTGTTAFITTPISAGGLYKDTVNGRLVLLVTGTTNNSNSLAVDMHLDFTGINAGSLSFDWATVFNGASASNRTATLKVYASTNGIQFTDLTAAGVTVTNFVPASGSVVNVALPASFSNSATAILRFYYYNSAGGSTGSRPAIALDNIKVTAQGSPCTTPSASATNLVFNTVTATSVSASFTAANPAPDGYMVVATTQGTLTTDPVDSVVYQLGDDVGDGIVVYQGNGTSFTTSGLNPLTAYTFYVFSVNQYCNGALRYNVANPLTGTQHTPAGPPCQAPTQPPSNLSFSNVTAVSMKGSFSSSIDANEYLVVASTNNSLTGLPANGMVYNAGDLLGGGTVVYRGGATQFDAVNLNHSTTYYYFVFGLNNFACSSGPVYLTAPILTGQQNTNILFPCQAPARNATSLILQPDQHAITGFFTPGDAITDAYLVVMSTNSSLNALPQDGLSYTTGSALGGDVILSTGKNYSFQAPNLQAATTYHFFIIPYNEVCTGGPLYKTGNYLEGDTATILTSPWNYYFGNLHAHSSYSDGNQDDKSKTPYDDYDFAKNAMCMDFLGISEHNHYTSNNNPGMTLPEYMQGINQAVNYTNVNPGFLALYGMEWGTLSNGGHSLLYGIDSLIGWETLNGTPNYNIYVPKNDYTSTAGLFAKINSFASVNAFATLAHPSFGDYQALAFSSYSASADSAVVGVALESGPAFSANTSYTEPGSNMEFLDYYLHLLSKGYRVAPLIDHDNHNMTFGRTASSRTVVIAPSISKNDFMQAMRSMHFYSTQDCNTKANISIYGEMMGSEFAHEYAPAITVVTENLVSSAVPTIKIMYGTPGSCLRPGELTASTGRSLSFTDITLPQNATAYYYADITYGNKRTITAPIWYTRLPDPLINRTETIQRNAGSSEVRLVFNPVADHLQLHIKTTQSCKAYLTVYSISGQKLSSVGEYVTNGTQQVCLPLTSLPAGVYIIESQLNGERFREKFVKL